MGQKPLCSFPYLYQFTGLLMGVNRETIGDPSVGEPTKVLLRVLRKVCVSGQLNIGVGTKRMLIFFLNTTPHIQYVR
jgi:hypothetical protein